MQIALNQKEITEGVRTYLASQGIAVEGKTFTVDFSMGRKGSGLSGVAHILGEAKDTFIPGFSDAKAETKTTVVEAKAVESKEDVKAEAPVETVVAVSTPEPDAADEPVVAAGAPTTTDNLFGDD